MPQLPIEILWIGLCTGLVFLMQAGFLCLESGLTRSKNNINVAVKNLADLGISLTLFWGLGYGLMFGQSYLGFIGISGFSPNLQASPGGETIYALYQAMFCGTAVTIVSGSIAERMRFRTYLLVAVVTSGIVYPIFGHWAWSDGESGAGWLKALGFFDFAGSTVVHSLGGWTALALLMIIGPRTGRFTESGAAVKIPGSNLPMAVLGTLILWFGWFGFNGGSTLGFDEAIPNVLVNTVLAGAGGLVAAMVLGSIKDGQAEVELLMNGSLAGLVAITANPLAISTGNAILVGAIGALVMAGVDALLVRQRIDDAVGAIPVHLGAGVWGTLAVPLFGDLQNMGITNGVWEQLLVQGVAVTACGAWAFGLTYVVFRLVDAKVRLRVTPEEELTGLNISEHGAGSELLELFTAMDQVSKTGDLSIRVPVEPFTEVGQIASRYNRVMDSLEVEVARTEAVVGSSMDGIVTFSRDRLSIQSLNPAASELFGVTTEDVHQRLVTQLIALEEDGLSTTDPDRSRRVFEEMVRLGDPVRARGLRSDGSSFSMEIQVTEARAGEESFFVATLRDLTERDRVEEQIRDLARFPDESPNPIFRVSAAGEVLYANQHGRALMQAWIEDMGHPLVETLKPALDDAAATNRVCEVEERCADKVFLFALTPVSETNYINIYCREITESKRQEEQIRDLARFPDENPNPVLRIASDGKVLYANAHASVLMDKWREDVGEPLVTTLASTIERAISTGEVVERECECGEKVFAFAVAPVEDETYVNVYTRDVTATKRAEEALRASEAQTRMIIDSALDGLVTIDSDGIVRGWNPQAVDIFGWEAEEAVGRRLSELIVPEVYREAHEKGLRHFLATGEGPVLNQRIEIEGLHKDGHVFPIELSISPVEVGDSYTFSAFVRDITERKENETALRNARDAAESANRAKSTFLANMSHELRTPLNAILGFSHLLTRDPGLTADQREDLEVIERSGEHLLTLINDVLEMSKIEAGQSTLNVVTFDLHRMVRMMEEMFELRAGDKGLQLLFEFTQDVPRFIESDEGKLRQILINLISNSVKFTEEGGVSLRVATSPYFGEEEEEGDADRFWLKFEIEDTGAGISDEEIDTLFDAFVQTESGVQSQEGTGLGLPISRRFVQLMGGDIEVSSVQGKGSLFKFQIKVRLSKEELAAVETTRHRVVGIADDQPDLRILIVEDKVENSKLLSKLLNQVGFETRVAVNGKEGIEVWEEWEPHLVWMDMRMPVMDGYEATKRIKATVKGQATVVVALTASAFEEQQTFILSAGCDDFVRKPFREAEIFDTMNKHLGIEFVYDDDDTGRDGQAEPLIDGSIKESLALQDVAWQDKLREAAEQADADAIRALVDEIAEEHPKLSESLARTAKDFNFHIILGMLDE